MNELKTWEEYLSQHSLAVLGTKAAAWDGEAERIEDRIFYEVALQKKRDPELRHQADEARAMSNRIREHIKRRQDA